MKLMDKGKKRLFILLGMASLLVYGAVFGVIWFLMTAASPAVRHIAVTALAAGFVMLLIVMTLGLGSLVLGLALGSSALWRDRKSVV